MARISGSASNDFLRGTKGKDTIYGFAGANEIWAGDEADLVYGGDGDDLIFGEDGNDRLIDESGNDPFERLELEMLSCPSLQKMTPVSTNKFSSRSRLSVRTVIGNCSNKS